MWQRARTSSKAGFDSLWNLVDKLGAPVNKLSNKLGSEAFWPTTLDKECDKAARILRSFCKDGFYERSQDEEDEVEDGPNKKRYSKVLKKIPAEVIKNAKGLAVFTTMRTGLWVSGAGGSGVLVAKMPDGNWSPPSGIMLHTAGVGFLVGVDIYDCVVVLNTVEAVGAFSKVRCTLGGEMSAVAGPIGMGGLLETEVHKRRAPVFTYLKSRGFYAGVQLDGTIVIERTDENERYYGRRVPVAEILAGKVSRAPTETQRLIQTIKLAQGDADIDPSMLPVEASPSDFDIASGQVFGVPARNDPDPYGVAALEEEGLVIREAGTRKQASRESFQFLPSPTSPLFSAFNQGGSRRSVDFDSRRSSWRTSSITENPAHMTDMATQTDVDSPTLSAAPSLTPRPTSATFVASMAGIPEFETIDEKLVSHDSDEATNPNGVEKADDMPDTSTDSQKTKPETSEIQTQTHAPAVAVVEATPIEDEASTAQPEPASHNSNGAHTQVTESSPFHNVRPHHDSPHPDSEADADDEDSSDETLVFHDVAETTASASALGITTASPQLLSKARLVNVLKPAPPALPSRNPNRVRGPADLPSPSLELVAAAVDLDLDLDPDADPHSLEPRPTSRGSSVYSLPKEDPPSSARGTESLASASSAEHGDAAAGLGKEPLSPELIDAGTGQDAAVVPRPDVVASGL